MVSREERATGIPTPIWLTTYRNKTSYVPFLLAIPPLFCSLRLKMWRYLWLLYLLQFPASISHGRTLARPLGFVLLSPVLLTEDSTGIQTKMVVLNQNNIGVKGRKCRKFKNQATDHWNWLTGKDPDAGKDGRQEEKGTTEDEMVGWHHRFDGHEFEQTLGVGDGQGGLACLAVHRVTKSQTQLSDWTELKPKT